jgi:oligopeptide/dipeptide ABC transporter ATP-binding protein
VSALVVLENLTKHFPVHQGFLQRVKTHVRAVDGVSFSIERGETVGLVGESGCGKSSLGRILVGLSQQTSGAIQFDGKPFVIDEKKGNFEHAKQVQIIFQDPFSALDPRLPVGDSIAEGLVIHGIGDKTTRRRDVAEMLDLVGLPASAMDRFPHEFSGGQRQRIGIARALILKPRFVVCDEPVSALDVSVQAQILNLLKQIQKELDLALLFISHNLAVVDHVCDKVAVMYLGRIVEFASRDELFGNPQHPYTRALLSAVPVADPMRKRDHILLTGDVPSPMNLPTGCRFNTRCSLAVANCSVTSPKARELSEGHIVECDVI